MSGSYEPRVLVAEDSLATVKIVQSCLERARLSVTAAVDGAAAWQAAQRQPFDLVLTDEQMPHLSGRELCRLLRRHPWYLHVPIIFLTAKQLELEESQLRDELRVAHVFGKPFSPEQLTRAVCAELGVLV
jgi:two-component system chemotaxis response regulator CheY